MIAAEEALDKQILSWMENQDSRPVYEDTEDSGVDWSLNRSESFLLWSLGEALGWQIEPWGGGFATWPDWFVEDVMKIHRRRGQLKELVKQTEGPSRRLGQ